MEHLRLGDSLGAETEIVQARTVPAGLRRIVEQFGPAILVVGKPGRRGWRDFLFGSVVDRIARQIDEIELYLVSAEDTEVQPFVSETVPAEADSPPYQQFLAAGSVVGICTLVGLGIWEWVAHADVVMVYLLGVMFVAYRMQRLPSVSAALLSVAAFNFFFTTPYHTFVVHNLKYWLTFGVMAVVGVAMSNLAARVKRQAEAARRREEATARLYEFVQTLAHQTDSEKLLAVAVEHIAEVFDAGVAIYRVDPDDASVSMGARAGDPPDPETDAPAITEAHAAGEPTGVSTKRLPGAEGLYLPMVGVSETFGVFGIAPASRWQLADPEKRDLLEAYAGQIEVFLERLNLSEEARQTQIELETERVRNAILSSVSHDLRTPLGSIMGAASTLTEVGGDLGRRQRSELSETIYEESRRLDRLLENLLKMTRIEGEDLDVDAQWQIPSEIVGGALSHLEPELEERSVDVELPEGDRMAHFDGPLVEQVLVNLLENAVACSSDDTPILVRSWFDEESCWFAVADRGEGVPEADRIRIFEKFQQGRLGKDQGSGLGLTICRAIVQAHGGTIEVHDRDEGDGAVFRFSLPQEAAPAVDLPPVADSDNMAS